MNTLRGIARRALDDKRPPPAAHHTHAQASAVARWIWPTLVWRFQRACNPMWANRTACGVP
eukprot:6358695-Alexandrium_andersonii.AAC.1